MRGRDFLESARLLAGQSSEVHWRSAINRAYCALILESRDALERWDFPPPPKGRVHAEVRRRLSHATDVRARSIGIALEHLVRLWNWADSRLDAQEEFESNQSALNAIDLAETMIDRLDQIESLWPRP